MTASHQEAVEPSDLFSSSSPLDKGTKGRSKTVLSLFDEEDKVEEQSSACVPQKEMAKVSRAADVRVPRDEGTPFQTGLLLPCKGWGSLGFQCKCLWVSPLGCWFPGTSVASP